MAMVQPRAVAKALGGREDRPRGQADATGQRQLQQLQRVHLLGKFEPEKVAPEGRVTRVLAGKWRAAEASIAPCCISSAWRSFAQWRS